MKKWVSLQPAAVFNHCNGHMRRSAVCFSSNSVQFISLRAVFARCVSISVFWWAFIFWWAFRRITLEKVDWNRGIKKNNLFHKSVYVLTGRWKQLNKFWCREHLTHITDQLFPLREKKKKLFLLSAASWTLHASWFTTSTSSALFCLCIDWFIYSNSVDTNMPNSFFLNSCDN